ncbi:MAG TPA: tripartite tricarboxylate transporter substrate binding protein [Thermomicrobiales bacterium]|nr:tripartite tricarboxylate transporter substrate binding protein [Thermomicrobiales bacterium]
MTIPRRRLPALLAASLAALLAAPGARAESFPDHSVRIVVPFPPGGSNDITARVLAQKLSERWGHQAVVDNRAGAGGNVGAELVAKAPADGYTLLLAAPGPLTVNQSLFRNLPFDPAKDFAPVALVASVPNVLMVHPSVPAKTVGELIALAKKQPGQLNFGSSGNGSTNHLAGELFKTMAGIDIVHVPYTGAAPAMNDLIGGHIPMMFDNMPGALVQIKAGTVRPIAVAGTKRAAALPDLPTVAESGVPGFEASSWFGLVARAGTPAAVLTRLTNDVDDILRMPEIEKRFAELGAEPGRVSGDAFGAFLRAETAKWSKVIKESGATVD